MVKAEKSSKALGMDDLLSVVAQTFVGEGDYIFQSLVVALGVVMGSGRGQAIDRVTASRDSSKCANLWPDTEHDTEHRRQASQKRRRARVPSCSAHSICLMPVQHCLKARRCLHTLTQFESHPCMGTSGYLSWLLERANA